jgi:hypothetical protein
MLLLAGSSKQERKQHLTDKEVKALFTEEESGVYF